MEYIGMKNREGFRMLAFCGQERCSIDANGRFKLSPRHIGDFESRCGGRVVFHCLPEGAVAIYPEDVYAQMRAGVGNVAEKAGLSLVQRRILRSFGALSQPETITRQGRLTLPQAFREKAGLQTGAEVCVVGVEIGVEVWNAERGEKELLEIEEHMLEKGGREMLADLNNDSGGSGE